MIKASAVEIFLSQADGSVSNIRVRRKSVTKGKQKFSNAVESCEILGLSPIKDSTKVIAKLTKGEEQAVAEVSGCSSKVRDRNHCSTRRSLLLRSSLVSGVMSYIYGHSGSTFFWSHYLSSPYRRAADSVCSSLVPPDVT